MRCFAVLYISHPARKMKLRTYGKGPFIMAVVHGGPGALGSIAPVAKELSQYFKVIMLNKCGHSHTMERKIYKR